MINRHRGEVGVRLGGRRHRLCLTLGALAELESELAAPDLVALAERFASGRPSGRDLLALLAAGLRGGGFGLAEAEIAGLTPDDGLPAVVAALADLLAVTFGGAAEDL
jgi:hypothetical protein